MTARGQRQLRQPTAAFFPFSLDSQDRQRGGSHRQAWGREHKVTAEARWENGAAETRGEEGPALHSVRVAAGRGGGGRGGVLSVLVFLMHLFMSFLHFLPHLLIYHCSWADHARSQRVHRAHARTRWGVRGRAGARGWVSWISWLWHSRARRLTRRESWVSLRISRRTGARRKGRIDMWWTGRIGTSWTHHLGWI